MSEQTQRADEVPLPGGDFRLRITRLSFQGLLSLGLLENPVTRTKQKNLPSAKMILDDLVLLHEKTLGNLDDEEQAHLDKVISDLRHAYERAV